MAEPRFLSPEFHKRLIKLCVDHEEKHVYDDLISACHDAYKEACDHAAEMAVHVFGDKPETLLRRVRPREDDAIRQYRLDSFEPITKSTCKKALNVVHKVFNSDGYSIRFESDKESQKLKVYALEEYPRFNSIINYFANFVLKKAIADPNGVILVQPFKQVTNSLETVQPFLTCYASKDIHLIEEGEYGFFFNKFEKDGKVKRWYYTYADRMAIHYLILEKNNSAIPTLTEVWRYEHGRDQVPFWHLGGDFSDKAEGLLESFFSGALPFWNEVIMDHSDLRGSIRMHMFPQKWEVADECEYVEKGDDGRSFACDGGYIFNQDKGQKYKCPECNGYGRKTVKGPYESYLVNKDRFSEQGFQVPFGYVEPGTEATKLLKEERDMGLLKGLSALNMDVLNNIGTNQSGISKDIDKRTELKEFLQKIADQFFEVHFPNAFDWFAWYMFSVQFAFNKEKLNAVQPQIAKPTEFDVYSVVELTEQFKGAKQSGLNPSFLVVEQAEIQNKKFQRNPDLLKVLNLELELDDLAEISRDDISIMLGNGTITKESAVIHDNIRAFVRRALEEDKNFADKSYLDKKEVLIGYAKEVIDASRIHLDMDAIEPGAVDPASGDTMDTPVDVEAEAKAKLKGSVGGVQGIIQIQESVAKGVTDYEAAVVLLFEIYGFEDKKARAILGDKAKLEAALTAQKQQTQPPAPQPDAE